MFDFDEIERSLATRAVAPAKAACDIAGGEEVPAGEAPAATKAPVRLDRERGGTFDFDNLEQSLSSKAAPAKAQPPKTPAKVTVRLDPERPELAVTQQVPAGGATIRWLRERLREEGPLWGMPPERLMLGAASEGSAAVPLRNDVALTDVLVELVLIDPGRAAREAEGGRAASGSASAPALQIGGQPGLAAAGCAGLTGAEEAGRLAQLDAAVAAAEEAGRTGAIVEALLARSEFHRQQGKAEQALADAEQCLNLSTCPDARTLFLCGKARLEAGGAHKEALGELRRAKRLDQSLAGSDEWILRAEHWGKAGSRPNHYRTLGLPADAPTESVRRAHRRMALVWHPDKPTGDAARFRAVQEAWEVLGDARRKAEYDFGGRRPAQSGAHGVPLGKTVPGPRVSPVVAAGAGNENGIGQCEFGLGGMEAFLQPRPKERPSADRVAARGDSTPAWVWTAGGVEEYAEFAEDLGHPSDGDAFTQKQLATVKRIEGQESGVLDTLARMQVIRRGGEGVGGPSVVRNGSNVVWGNMRSWPSAARASVPFDLGGGGPPSLGMFGSGGPQPPKAGVPQPPKAEQQRPRQAEPQRPQPKEVLNGPRGIGART